MNLIDKDRLLNKIDALEPFNNSDAGWVRKVIAGMHPIQCEDCIHWNNYYCRQTGQIRGRNSVCEDWRNR